MLAASCGAEGAVNIPVPEARATASPSPEPSNTGPENLDAAAVSTAGPTVVWTDASLDAPPYAVLRSGVLMPVTSHRPPFLEVLTPCEVSGWVHAPDVELHDNDPDRATVVIDPGHGGQHTGAVGPTGLTEKEANLAIARRLVGKLEGNQVFMTLDDDYTAGLSFRTTLANRLGADLFVSIHNNADPDGPSVRPGAETYYQIASPDSRRMAGLLYEELLGALSPLDVTWVSDDDAGAKYRLNSSGGDYYALLRLSEVPAVLVEAAFIVNAPEEELLRTGEGQELIAEAIANGIRRHLETDDPGSGFVTPNPRTPGPSGRLPAECQEPT
jgi:N-acetylmuramoyl-L-alanine amidase